MEIAVILTCYNRKEKTLSSLNNLINAQILYNKKNSNNIALEIFITDDGSTDGTADSVAELLKKHKIKYYIHAGDGNLYWAGGMKVSWEKALQQHNRWDFYLLINDDTDPAPNAFEELLACHDYALRKYKIGGLYSGICFAKGNSKELTYGGKICKNKILGGYRLVKPDGNIQECDVTNANILLIDKSVIDKIGIFYNKYRHGNADYDYSCMAKKNGIPVLLTANATGYCDRDHQSPEEIKDKLLKMTLSERIRYFKHPLHSTKDYLILIRRTTPLRYPIVALGRILILYFPKIYYKIDSISRCTTKN